MYTSNMHVAGMHADRQTQTDTDRHRQTDGRTEGQTDRQTSGGQAADRQTGIQVRRETIKHS